MRYAKLSCINASQWTYSLIGLLAVARRIIEGLFVLLYRSFVGTGSLVFSGTQHGVWCLCGVVHDSHIFSKPCFAPKMGKISQAQGSLNV